VCRPTQLAEMRERLLHAAVAVGTPQPMVLRNWRLAPGKAVRASWEPSTWPQEGMEGTDRLVSVRWLPVCVHSRRQLYRSTRRGSGGRGGWHRGGSRAVLATLAKLLRRSSAEARQDQDRKDSSPVRFPAGGAARRDPPPGPRPTRGRPRTQGQPGPAADHRQRRRPRIDPAARHRPGQRRPGHRVVHPPRTGAATTRRSPP
jgi:hypothetical protein